MPQKTLRFKIHQDGRVEETVEGFTGNSCNEATKNLEDALGKVTVKKKHLMPSSQTKMKP